MNVLCDRHHADLLYSLQKLFEDRLGYDLYVPIGQEWWDNGYWQFGKHAWGDDRLARQFLYPNDSWREVAPGLFLTFDTCHPERPLYGVTLSKAKEATWDAVVATVDDNQRGFHRFASETEARYYYHVGNSRQAIDAYLDPIVLNASNADIPNSLRISEEFDDRTIFRYRPLQRTKQIVSFVNLLSRIPEAWSSYEALTRLLPGYSFASFGHDCPDGFLQPVAAIAEEMARTTWAYHDKVTGDGFGHIIHNWAAVGRPLIGHARYYRGQRAEALWQDGVTCIDLDRHSIEEVAEIIRATSLQQLNQMSQAIHAAFLEIYDPGADSSLVAGTDGVVLLKA